jgi:hypothetical protein
MKRAAAALPGVRQDTPAIVRFTAFGEWALDFTAYVEILGFQDRMLLRHELMKRLHLRLRAARRHGRHLRSPLAQLSAQRPQKQSRTARARRVAPGAARRSVGRRRSDVRGAGSPVRAAHPCLLGATHDPHASTSFATARRSGPCPASTPAAPIFA